MDINFISGEALSEEYRIKISRIFAKSFYQWFQYFSHDTEKIALAFQNSFVLEQFYFAVCENEICGMAACTDGKNPSIKFVKKDLHKQFGIFKGTIAWLTLKKEIENHPYPFRMESSCGSIEFVAVDEKFRKKGIATNLLKHIINAADYDEFILEVADTNTSAVNLYKNVGFEVFMSIPCKSPKQTGFNNYLYMRYKKQVNGQ